MGFQLIPSGMFDLFLLILIGLGIENWRQPHTFSWGLKNPCIAHLKPKCSSFNLSKISERKSNNCMTFWNVNFSYFVILCHILSKKVNITLNSRVGKKLLWQKQKETTFLFNLVQCANGLDRNLICTNLMPDNFILVEV